MGRPRDGLLTYNTPVARNDVDTIPGMLECVLYSRSASDGVPDRHLLIAYPNPHFILSPA